MERCDNFHFFIPELLASIITDILCLLVRLRDRASCVDVMLEEYSAKII